VLAVDLSLSRPWRWAVGTPLPGDRPGSCDPLVRVDPVPGLPSLSQHACRTPVPGNHCGSDHKPVHRPVCAASVRPLPRDAWKPYRSGGNRNRRIQHGGELAQNSRLGRAVEPGARRSHSTSPASRST